MFAPKKTAMKILMVATEASPFVSVGGAAQVVNHLSKALELSGNEVAVFIPKFGFISEEKYQLTALYEGLKVPTGDEQNPYLMCNIKTAEFPSKVKAYFLENQEYYEKRANVYGYSDDPTRWALLSRGVLEFIRLKIFIPDIIHCNDWHTGLVCNYLKSDYANDPVLSKIAAIYTIHNLAFQGMFDHKHVSELDYDDGKSLVAPFFDNRLKTQNFMKRGILYSDVVSTVSKSYSKEILTPEFGEGLDKLLLELKGKIFGIVNGIDYEEMNPATDSLIEKNYDINSIGTREVNKKALQKEFDLPEDSKALLLGFVGRLDNMKGVDLLLNTMEYVLRDYPIQFVQIGGGDGGLVEMLHQLKNKYPKSVGIHPYPNFTLPRLVFAGADCVVYPSRFEPCGIVQIEAMRYGAVPIVRKVGGLSDTVVDFDSGTLEGTGFVFSHFDEYALYGQIVRAYENYRNKPLWLKLQKNAMKADFSWFYSAREYVKLYEKAKSIVGKQL
ncbi:MAG: starch synthase [Candidatus Moranbacteria bacterium CG_4_9_14_3_um_filter_42_9]|nr:MAG: starch synthase [Candidatus Moranbacteria bacterium CG_4_9_14_3_um_filter_42_9]